MKDPLSPWIPCFNEICFAAGASLGFLQLGFVDQIYKFKCEFIQRVKIFKGASIGSMIAYLLFSGLPPSEVITKCSGIQYMSNIRENLDWQTFINEGSLLSIEKYEVLIQKILLAMSIDPDLTFQDTRRRNPDQKICIQVTNLNRYRAEILSVDTVPEMTVSRALAVSMALPVIVKPVMINGCYYTDGGLFNYQATEGAGANCLSIVGLSYPEQKPDYCHNLIGMLRCVTEYATRVSPRPADLITVRLKTSVFSFIEANEEERETLIREGRFLAFLMFFFQCILFYVVIDCLRQKIRNASS